MVAGAAGPPPTCPQQCPQVWKCVCSRAARTAGAGGEGPSSTDVAHPASRGDGSWTPEHSPDGCGHYTCPTAVATDGWVLLATWAGGYARDTSSHRRRFVTFLGPISVPLRPVAFPGPGTHPRAHAACRHLPYEGAVREAHLSAEQPPPQPQARLPGPHAHAAGSDHRQQPATSRTREAVGLIPVSPVEVDRLSDGREIGAVLRGRRQHAGHLAVVHVREDQHDGPPRVAVVASRRVGSAVSRNRAKRLLREAARHVAWRPGTDVVLVARAACAGSLMPPVRDEVEQLADRLGVLEAEDAA